MSVDRSSVRHPATFETHLILSVVVLGGDTPLALPLIVELERKGYIVVASVSSPDFGHNLERRCQGYVRALVLDPNEVCGPLPLRSVQYESVTPSPVRSRYFCARCRPSSHVGFRLRRLEILL